MALTRLMDSELSSINSVLKSNRIMLADNVLCLAIGQL